MKFTLAIGASMLALGAILQQAGYYDLGNVGDGTEDMTHFVDGASKVGGSVVNAMSKGFPVTGALLWGALLLGGLRYCVIAVAPILLKRQEAANARITHELEERAKAADHARQIELAKAEREARSQ